MAKLKSEFKKIAHDIGESWLTAVKDVWGIQQHAGLSADVFKNTLVPLFPYSAMLTAWWIAALMVPPHHEIASLALAACLPVITWAWASLTGNLMMIRRLNDYREFTRDLANNEMKASWYRAYQASLGELRQSMSKEKWVKRERGLPFDITSLVSLIALLAAVVKLMSQMELGKLVQSWHVATVQNFTVIIMLVLLAASAWTFRKGVEGGVNDQTNQFLRRVAAVEARGRVAAKQEEPEIAKPDPEFAS